MPAMAQVPKDHPLMLAWEAHKQSEEYANSRTWAAHPQHIDGSLWALFEAGWRAAHLTQSAQEVDVERVREVIAEMSIKAPTVKPAHLNSWIKRLTAALPNANGKEG